MKKNINKNKNCFVTIDFEDWYTLPYLIKYNFKRNDCESFCTGAFWPFFLKQLREENVNATFFVVATMLETADETIKRISSEGFLIGCHAYNHENLKNMTLSDFVETTSFAKSQLEKAIGKPVVCYRAPSFSSSLEMLLSLPNIGFCLDSSYINSKANEFYTEKDLSSWNTNQNGFLINENIALLEAEIPTVFFLGKRIPIGGGGFFRLIPFWFYKYLVKKYLKTHDNFIFFIHPYELNYHSFNGIHKLTLKEKIKFNFNRKNAIKKFWKLIRFFKKQGMTFNDFSPYIDSCLK